MSPSEPRDTGPGTGSAPGEVLTLLAVAPGEALDLLAIAPHPDDAEIGAGATLALHAARGHRVGVLDLTRGELGTNGTPEERLREAGEAARVLGLAWRGNLGLPDRGLAVHPGAVAQLARTIRRLRPRVVLLPSPTDGHPDHRTATALAREAVMSAGLPKWDPETLAHRVERVLYYFVDPPVHPSLLVDGSGYLEVKMRALRCHASQFLPGPGRMPTVLNDGHYLARVEHQARYLGASCGRQDAEAFSTPAPPVLSNLVTWTLLSG
ncbi:MAG: bacillithiol biosynthesis deacetylase BshB1 [Bacillota bacterium]|nr:bacillithiol biosynthesis deacetylase BshB1 [Bacillota bacterium]